MDRLRRDDSFACMSCDISYTELDYIHLISYILLLVIISCNLYSNLDIEILVYKSQRLKLACPAKLCRPACWAIFRSFAALVAVAVSILVFEAANLDCEFMSQTLKSSQVPNHEMEARDWRFASARLADLSSARMSCLPAPLPIILGRWFAGILGDPEGLV